MAKQGYTYTPAGLNIIRNGMEFTLTWKIVSPDHGDGQQVQWRSNLTADGVWNNFYGVTSVDTSITGTLVATGYYPTSKGVLTGVTFRVRGKRSESDGWTFTWSNWAEKTFQIRPPRVPSLEAELGDVYPQTEFSWEVITDSSDEFPLFNVKWESILVKGCTETNGEKLNWNSSQSGYQSGVGDATGTKTIYEDSTTLANGSYTRWFRAQSRGAGGASKWVYTKHVYAKPYAPTIDTKKTKTYAAFGSGSTTNVRAEWTSPTNAAYPIDYTEVQYVIGTPAAANLVAPSSGWETGETILDSAGTDIAQFVIDGRVDEDQCLWIRVANFHDLTENPSYSNAVLLMSGKLAAPEFNGDVTANPSTRTVTIQFDDNSEVPDSRVGVVFYRGNNPGYIAGVATHGQTSITINNLLPWTESTNVAFGLFAFRGSYTYSTGSSGGYSYRSYSVTDATPMTSDTVTQGGNVPVAPTGVSVSQTDGSNEALVRWNWNWSSATQAEVSWSTNRNAWQSTEEPETYLVPASNAPLIRVSNLELGSVWYFRVRFVYSYNDSTNYGPYSNVMSVALASAPLKPSLTLSGTVVQTDTVVTASWLYDSTDGTPQSAATLSEYSIVGDTVTYIQTVATIGPQHYCTFKPETARWVGGTTHYLRLRVTSASGLVSEWSEFVPISVANPINCEIVSTSLGPELIIPFIYPADNLYPTVYPSNGQDGQKKLSEMPLTATISGAGTSGITTVAIERLMDYSMERPDGSQTGGFAGETIAIVRQTGESEITIGVDDLIGTLDDGAWYLLVATVQDTYGQSDTKTLRFLVDWDHQATMPEASVSMDGTASVIVVDETNDVDEGDYCEIYRLSADKPEMIVSHGDFGVPYVDPYPAIGVHGGHRVVFRTVNGDYITEDNHPAWIDLRADAGDYLESRNAIINFGGDSVTLKYNIDTSSRWSKDFRATKYLGGSVQGDWNPAIERTGTVSAVTITIFDEEQIAALRRLATYTGVCHVRTPDGSSYSADVQVSESRSHNKRGVVASFTLSFTRIDPERLDGLPYDEWSTFDYQEPIDEEDDEEAV